MIKANMDIRVYMADHGVTQKMIADFLGIAQGSVSVKPSKELSQKDKEVFLNLIDSIVADNMEEPAAEEIVEAEEEIEEVEEAEEVEQTEEAAEDAEDAEEDAVEEADASCVPKFQIGDLVKLPSKILRLGTVGDIWISLANNKVMYAVDTDGGGRGLYDENQLEPAPIPVEYSFEAYIDGNVAVAIMNAKQGEKRWVYARGHAHIIHDGEVGMAQAISYAARRMFESLDTKQENRIYFK